MAISTAIDITRVSRVIGYKIMKGFFGVTSPYLPQRIAVLGEANTANQATITEDPFEFTDADAVGAKYGYGSPLHQIARILRPKSGNILGGIPTVIYPQKEDGSPTVTTITTSVAFQSGSEADANETQYLKINGRTSIDGQSYQMNIEKGDTNDDVIQKAVDAVNSVIGAPVSAATTGAEGSLDMELTSKWKGVTSADITVEVEEGDNLAGLTWSPESDKTDGTGDQSVTDSLNKFGDVWNTIVINPYDSTVFTELEDFNGVPDPSTPTGRYVPTIFKPFIAFFGNVDTTESAVTTITDASARKDQVTNVMAPAPGSAGFKWEAAANMALITAPVMQNAPHSDNSGMSYFDMPVGSDIGDFGDYNSRDVMVKAGASTVTVKNGKYTIQDSVTTYHPDGENPPKFRFTRDLNVDWNVGYGWLLIMDRDIQDKAIVADNSPSTVSNTISPKQAKQLVISYAGSLAQRALIADLEFTEESIETGINETNPARLDIFFKYKRTSTAHQVSTDATVDFFFSS